MLDLAIIGGGPAGLTAGLYATRGGLKNVVLYESLMPGGQITKSSEIENYPGAIDVVSGITLMERWPEQCCRFGLKIESDEVNRVTLNSDKTFKLYLSSGKEVDAKSVIVATGSTPKKGGFEGEEQFYGRGISSCATCDGFFYRNKEVAVVGGGDSALEEALYLSNICSKVYIIHRRDSFKAAPSTVERVKNSSKIEIIYNSSVKKAFGGDFGLDGLIIENLKTKEEHTLNVPGLFVFIGYNVNNGLLKQANGEYLCAISYGGEVIVDINMHTSIDGLFAAGDIRISAPKQVVCAAGDGATSALSAISYLEGHSK